MSDSATTAETYTQAVKRASLEQIRLVSSTFKVVPEFRDDDDSVQRFWDQRVVGTHFDEASEMLVGTVRCRIWVTKGAAPEPNPSGKSKSFEASLLSIQAMYVIVFKMPGGHGQETLEAFMKNFGPFSVWPYFRAHLSHIASEAQLSLPVLPIKKLFQSVESAGGYVESD